MIILLLVLLLTAFPHQAEAEVAPDVRGQWVKTLRYGIDSQVLEVVGMIVASKDSTFTEELEAIVVRSKNHDVQKAVLDLLAGQGEKGAEDAARSIIHDQPGQPSGLVSSAIRYLAAVNAADAVKDITPLIDSTDKGVATEAILALGKTRDLSVTRLLLDKLASADFPDALKSQLILALGELKDPAAVDALIGIVKTDEDKTRRMYAADALGKIADPRAVPALRQLFGEDDALIRAYAASSLARFDVSLVVDDIFQGLRDDNWRVRIECTKALGRPLPPDRLLEATDILSFKAEHDPVAQVRVEAINTLGEIGGDAAFGFLLGVYTNSHSPLDSREKALSVIVAKNLTEAAAQAIRAAVEADFSSRDQRAILSDAKVISTVQSENLKPLLLRFLESTDVSTRLYAIKGIELNGFSDLKERLAGMAATDPTPVVQKEAKRVSDKL
jgi:HEAT repeat protein